MSRSKYASVVGNIKVLYDAIVASIGVSDAGKIVATNAQGVLDATLMPAGVQVATVSAQASEALSAGDFVNLHNVAGSLRVRKANASTGIPATGFVSASVASGANAVVVLDGMNTALSSLSPGTLYFLGATGGVTVTPPSSTVNAIIQELGTSFSATSLWFTRQDHILVQ